MTERRVQDVQYNNEQAGRAEPPVRVARRPAPRAPPPAALLRLRVRQRQARQHGAHTPASESPTVFYTPTRLLSPLRP